MSSSIFDFRFFCTARRPHPFANSVAQHLSLAIPYDRTVLGSIPSSAICWSPPKTENFMARLPRRDGAAFHRAGSERSRLQLHGERGLPRPNVEGDAHVARAVACACSHRWPQISAETCSRANLFSRTSFNRGALTSTCPRARRSGLTGRDQIASNVPYFENHTERNDQSRSNWSDLRVVATTAGKLVRYANSLSINQTVESTSEAFKSSRVLFCASSTGGRDLQTDSS